MLEGKQIVPFVAESNTAQMYRRYLLAGTRIMTTTVNNRNARKKRMETHNEIFTFARIQDGGIVESKVGFRHK